MITNASLFRFPPLYGFCGSLLRMRMDCSKIELTQTILLFNWIISQVPTVLTSYVHNDSHMLSSIKEHDLNSTGLYFAKKITPARHGTEMILPPRTRASGLLPRVGLTETATLQISNIVSASNIQSNSQASSSTVCNIWCMNSQSFIRMDFTMH